MTSGAKLTRYQTGPEGGALCDGGRATSRPDPAGRTSYARSAGPYRAAGIGRCRRQCDSAALEMTFQPTEHVAFDLATHGAIQTTDFPMDAVVDRLTVRLRRPRRQLNSPGKSCTQYFAGRGAAAKTSAGTHVAAFRKFLALSAALRPELFDGRTLEQIGRDAGCTKANLSKAALQFTTQFGLKFRRQHSGRDNMRRARVLSYQKQKRKHDEPTHSNAPA